MSRAALTGLLTLLTTSQALAADFTVQLEHRFARGQRLPAIVLKVNRAVTSAELELTGADGSTVELSAASLNAGTSHSFQFPAPVGTTVFKGKLRLLYDDDTGIDIPMELPIEVLQDLTLSIPEEKVQVRDGRLEAQLSRPVDRCELVVDFDGAEPRTGQFRFTDKAAGDTLVLTWQPHGREDVVLRILVLCFDRTGTRAGVELFPWWLEIEHEDIVFGKGSADITKSEQKKLDAAYTPIANAISRYGGAYSIKLYISGHTDTVGDRALNADLSLRRARAIAEALRKRGVGVPIFYAGFGETHLRVPTGDEVDEPRNRRARYIVAMQEPEAAAWVPLK